MEQPLHLNGKNGIIIGAASGIGRATTIHLSELGENIAMGDLDFDGLEDVARQIGAVMEASC